MSQPTYVQPAAAPTSSYAPNGSPTPVGHGMDLLAEFATYPQAQDLVDQLSDDGFPVRHVRIVGTGIHSVEQVTGRLTRGRAALGGAASGAWFGLFIGLLFGLFAVGTALFGVLLGSLLIGAFWGGVFGFVAHWATRGRRDFSSVRGMEADRYQVQVASSHTTQATGLLSRA